MTFLEICQRVYQEGSGSGSLRPTAVTAQTGDMLLVVNWAIDAWKRIQTNKRTWRWLYADATVSVGVATRDYSIATIFPSTPRRFSHWKPDGFKFYTTADGVASEYKLNHYFFEERYQAEVGSASSADPAGIVVMPDRSLRIIESPSRVGTMTATYYKSPQILAANTDEPEMPEQHHMLIVWLALMRYARKEAATEVYEDASNNVEQMMKDLIADQLEPPELHATTLVVA